VTGATLGSVAISIVPQFVSNTNVVAFFTLIVCFGGSGQERLLVRLVPGGAQFMAEVAVPEGAAVGVAAAGSGEVPSDRLHTNQPTPPSTNAATTTMAMIRCARC